MDEAEYWPVSIMVEGRSPLVPYEFKKQYGVESMNEVFLN
jgi:hypothetical protein